jgi:hypothetical protein
MTTASPIEPQETGTVTVIPGFVAFHPEKKRQTYIVRARDLIELFAPAPPGCPEQDVILVVVYILRTVPVDHGRQPLYIYIRWQ